MNSSSFDNNQYILIFFAYLALGIFSRLTKKYERQTLFPLIVGTLILVLLTIKFSSIILMLKNNEKLDTASELYEIALMLMARHIFISNSLCKSLLETLKDCIILGCFLLLIEGIRALITKDPFDISHLVFFKLNLIFFALFVFYIYLTKSNKEIAEWYDKLIDKNKDSGFYSIYFITTSLISLVTTTIFLYNQFSFKDFLLAEIFNLIVLFLGILLKLSNPKEISDHLNLHKKAIMILVITPVVLKLYLTYIDQL